MDSTARHAELLYQRVMKTFRHYRKRFERETIGSYRLYDWTIPEVRARIDYYEGHVVVAEYVRQQTQEWPNYLEALGEAAARAVGAPAEAVHLKRRSTRVQGSAGGRYGRLGRAGSRLSVRERDMKFWVNLDDYIDTGLFADHRDTRALVRGWAQEKSVLNLYCYSGSFSVAAALGGARSSTSVDISRTYLSWTEDNMTLNRCGGRQHELVEADCETFLKAAGDQGRRWDLVILDPPSFSTIGGFSSGAGEFDVMEAHPRLLQAALRCVAPSGKLLFSTNHQRFEPRFSGLPASAEELTHRTVPEDFQKRGTFQKSPVHRSFLFTRAG